MKKIIALLLMVVAVVTLVSCGQQAKGSVYYLNFKPEVDSNWQALAAEYTKETGVEVKVVTAASGKYEETLTAEMAKSAAPTLFQISGTVGYANWSDYCLDLSGSDVYKDLTSDSFAVKVNNGIYGIAYVYEAYGIIVNKGLLESKTTYKVADITSFDKLKEVAEYVHANAATLGFDAFTNSNLDGSSSWRFSGHLANVALSYEFQADGITSQPATIKATYSDNMKAVWDLYVNNTAYAKSSIDTAKDAEAEFKAGEAVFFQNGVWEYPAVGTKTDGTTAIELAYLPIFMGIDDANEGFCSGTENYWAVNKTASKADQKATLDFLHWVANSEKGTAALAAMGFAAPFKNAKASGNTLSDLCNEWNKTHSYGVSWVAMNNTPNTDAWRANVVSALSAYTQGTGEWSAVKAAMVDGWATNYAGQNQ